MKILHITCWYPNKENPQEALWIKRHIEALDIFCSNEVYHLEVKPSNNFRIRTKSLFPKTRTIRILAPVKHWFIIEIISSILVSWVLFWKRNKFDSIVFHIAYPNLTFIPKALLNKPFFVMEHWSAYHFNFGVENQEKLNRIKKIFWNQNLNLITVSCALGKDIKKFSDNSSLSYSILPNVVDTNVFYFKNLAIEENTFFMLSTWAKPKDPFMIIKALELLRKKNSLIKLRIGGGGKLIPEMRHLVNQLLLNDYVKFMGQLNPEEIAYEMNKAYAFVHCSGYETFSVVCAESLCCGTPVIASNVGGIKELSNQENGIMLVENQQKEWANALMKNHSRIEREKSSLIHCETYNKKNIGEKYFELLKKK